MGPPRKRQKVSADRPAEIIFDDTARQDYLTGFHKRKVARAELAKEAAVKRAREEKVAERRQLREQKKHDLEEHVKAVNLELRKLNPDLDFSSEGEGEDGAVAAGEESALFDGLSDQEQEFVDEDKYTTVTVEPMLDGTEEEIEEETSNRDINGGEKSRAAVTHKRAQQTARPKQKKKKFRYESKAERKETRFKQKAKNRKAALARKGDNR